MKSRSKKLLTVITIMACIAALWGCSSDDNSDDATIKIGCMTTTEPIVELVAAGIEDQGYTIEAVLFDENNMPCTALKDGDVDGVILNHKAWLKTFNEQNGSDLVMIEPYWYHSPFRLYSAKYDSIDELPDGAQIAVPSDSTNLERALVLLDEVGLIELGEKSSAFYTPVDIESNPKNIEFVTAEITTAANSINDADAVISPAVYIAEEGTLDPNDYLYDDPHSAVDYPLGLIVQSDSKDADWVKAASDYMTTPEAKEAFDAIYNGAYGYLAVQE